MDLGFILLGLALIGAVIFLVAQPFLERHSLRERPPRAADDLTAEREGVLIALRDLDFDHSTGKLTDDDHAAQRTQLLARGAKVLKQLDALGGAVPDDDVESAIERAVAARRKGSAAQPAPLTSAVARCPTCRAEVRAADRFCASCGGALARVCAQCAAPLAAGDQFCGACGAAVADRAEP
jgi:hypothetical protein